MNSIQKLFKGKGKESRKLRKLTKILPHYDPWKDSDGYFFDEDTAQWALDFFPACIKHVKGKLARTPYYLSDHEKAIVANLFGWKKLTKNDEKRLKASKTPSKELLNSICMGSFRRFSEVLYFVARKNSKTTLAAGVAMLVLGCDGEVGAEVYSVASDRNQARICFDIAKRMTMYDDELGKRYEVYANAIMFEEDGNFYKAISSEAGTKHGFNAHLTIVDEVHALPNGELVDVMTTSVGSRVQPITFYITTADYERPSICNEIYERAIAVRNGSYPDPTFLPAIFEAENPEDWTNPEQWALANPNLGKSVRPEYLQKECDKAQVVPRLENTFKRLHLNIRTQAACKWLDIDVWHQNDSSTPAERKSILKSLEGRECFGAVDLSSTQDMTAYTLIFPMDDDAAIGEVGNVVSLTWFWIPEARLVDKANKHREMYQEWVNQGHLTTCPGGAIDDNLVLTQVLQCSTLYSVKTIGVDRWNALHVMNRLEDEGYDVVTFGQGYQSMSGPSKKLEKLLINRQFNPMGNPILEWQAGNVMIEESPNEDIKPSKKKSSQKIDGIVTNVIALGMCMLDRQERVAESVYEKRGIRTA